MHQNVENEKDGVMEVRVCCTYLTSKTETLILQAAGTVSNYLVQAYTSFAVGNILLITD